MELKRYWNFCTLVVTLLISASTCIEFDRKVTGVEFSAYVKRKENGEIPGWKTYTMKDIRTMLEVISTKFTKVATSGVGTDNVSYMPNKTYYDSNAQVMTAEAAALINRDRKNKSLGIIIGMWQSDIRTQMNSEVRVALESAQIANSIYPGTVEGLVFTHNEIDSSLKRAKQTLERIRAIRKKSVELDAQVGTRQKCKGLTSEKPDEDTEAGKLLSVRQKIVAESDFIICEVELSPHNFLAGPKSAFLIVGSELFASKAELKNINPSIEVMGQTRWPGEGHQRWENVDNMRDYWMEADKWASKHNFNIWLFEAFDNPWRNWSPKEAHYGWWRLKSNSLISRRDGYTEKINEPITSEVKNKPTCENGQVELDKLISKVEKLQEDLSRERQVKAQLIARMRQIETLSRWEK